MRPVSDAFLRAVRGSHRAVFEARVVAPGQTGVDPDGTVVPIGDGSDVLVDGAADIRSTVSLTIPDGSLWPRLAADLLAPYGNEIFVRRGVRFGAGSTEWVSLGYHRINTPEQDDAPDGPIVVQATDRMAGIIDGRLTAPRAFASSTTRGSMLSALVSEIYPWATIEWDDTAARDTTLGRQIIVEEDRHAACNDLVASAGKTWWWDHRGILVVRTPAAAGGLPVFDVDHGAGGVLVSLSRRLTRDGVYNAVVAVGEGVDTATPVRAVAVDQNPGSPTYWGGPFGRVPRFYSSPFITTTAQAATAAMAMLREQLGLPYAVDFSAVPNPALEPGDVVRVRYPRRSELHVIEQLRIPLTVAAPLSGSTREQTVVLIGGG